MRINCHCHVFNFASVFSDGSLGILEMRLKRYNVPPRIIRVLASVLRQLFKQREKGLSLGIPHRELANRLFGIKAGTGILPDQLEKLLPKSINEYFKFSLNDFMKGLVELDPHISGVTDWADFVGIGLLPDIDTVTDHLIGQLTKQDIVVPHMMDITDGTNEDISVFRNQIDNTARQALRYPGRVLPFYAVNPNRPGFMKRFVEEVTEGHFVGVKIYPSLGYKVNTKRMKDVFKVCNEMDLPVLMHCSPGGFYANKDTIGNCHPVHWKSLLAIEELKKLKICFAHFGGTNFYVPPSNEEKYPPSWPGTILQLMERFGSRVFADLACHTYPMKWYFTDHPAYKEYFAKVKGLLNDPAYRSQILWGTDYWMNRMQVKERNYYSYFSRRLKTHMTQLTDANARRFLGIPKDGEPVPGNIDRHLSFLRTMRHTLPKNQASQWVKGYIW
jgi:predicted TIM-barrel fold metal-dependent hydrolase